jgi:hypothetical protein
MRVKNIRTEVLDEEKDVYIGRGSKWGNPFVIGKDGDRNQVIEMYKKYFDSNDELKKDIEELRNKNLVCYCSPKKCHGEVLIEEIMKRKHKNEELRKQVSAHAQATHKKRLEKYMMHQLRQGLVGVDTLKEFLQTTEVKTESGKSTGFTYSKKMEDVGHDDSTCACLKCERVRRVRYMKARKTSPDTPSRYY